MRWIASTCFLSAAFAWVPPYLDRAGVAALGFAFLALTVGRGAVGASPPVPFIPAPEPAADLGDVGRMADAMVARIAEYGAKP